MKKKKEPKSKTVFVHYFSDYESVNFTDARGYEKLQVDFSDQFQAKIDKKLEPLLSNGWRIKDSNLNTSTSKESAFEGENKSAVHFTALFILEQDETK